MISAYISPLKTCSEPTDSLYLCVNLNINTIMKKNMKKLLVIALALMPSLSISVMAQSPGGGTSDPNPECIPVIPQPSPIPNPTPRIASQCYDVPPIKPLPDPDPNPTPIPRVRANGPDDIPVIPDPNTNPGGGPRFRNSAQAPHCYHIGGVVYIDADATVTAINASVTRYDDNQVWSDASNTNTLSITTSADAGSYLLELTLSTGKSYKGKFIIE